MMFGFPWRSGLLALAVLVGGAGGVQAHALPGSVVLLRQQGPEIRLTVQFPLEDLIIAAPDLEGLEEARPGDELPQEMAGRFERYLRDHLAVTEGGDPLALTLSDARVQPAYHDHLGHFLLVVSEWRVVGSLRSPVPLVLEYDVVMHEVRNHRAVVQWISQDGEARPVAEFGYFGAERGVPLDLSGF